MKFTSVIAATGLSLGATASPFVTGPTAKGGVCHDIAVPIEVTAQNYDFSKFPGIKNPGSLLKSQTFFSALETLVFSKSPVTGSEVYTGTYCEPIKQVAGRNNSIQMMIHGITYTRDYWHGTPKHIDQKMYSWVEYALAQGYPTLALDRIGNGLSSHPDPVTTLQMPYEVRATHALIQMVKKGTTKQLPRPFKKTIVIGHSYGSVLSNNLANEFPDDADATILTGFSKRLLRSLPGIALLTPEPASMYDAQRFGSLPPGYVVTADKANRKISFFYKNYKQSVYNIDFANMGTVGVAEVMTVFTDITEAPEYKNKVFVLTGNNDEPFCGYGRPDLPEGRANCGTGPGSQLAQTKDLFPAASAYGYYAIPDTGHCLNLHTTAPDAYSHVHKWLSKEGF